MINDRLPYSIVSLLIITSCSMFGGDPTKNATDDYRLPSPPKDWSSQPTRDADYRMTHKDGRSIMIQSFCHEFQSPSLENLADGTFQSFDSYQINETNKFTYRGRNALETIGTGNIDGVTFNVSLINTKRDNCYYDFLEIRPHKNQASSLREFINGIKFK